MFKTGLDLREAPQSDFWAVAAPLVWEDTEACISVPVGFLTDLASVPRILRNLPGLDPDGVSRSPAVLHDWLYRTHQFTRAKTDGLFRAALLFRGCTGVDAWIFYLGVRIGGRSSYTPFQTGPQMNDFDTVDNFKAWRLSNPR